MAMANNNREMNYVPGILSPVLLKPTQAEMQNPEIEFERLQVLQD
jgi:hypothetical protein